MAHPPVVRAHAPLAPLTTLRVGGPAETLIEVCSTQDLADEVLIADLMHRPLFVLGGGSNVLVGDEGFTGVCVHTCEGDVHVEELAGERVRLTAEAGCTWDSLVERAVGLGAAGLEGLSGIPGQIGSAVMQNLGAYGQEVGSCLHAARLFDRKSGETRTWRADELGLGYRTSMLRRSMESAGAWGPTPRWVVLEASFDLVLSPENAVNHEQLARALGCACGERLPLSHIREAVLAVRAAKGMVADPDPLGPNPLHDRWSSGSFFTNPVVDEHVAEALPADAPRYAAGAPGLVKVSAAWLIDRAGFGRGWGVYGPSSPATLSNLHTLALTNRGGACARDVAELARTVRAGVLERFGIELVPETVLVGLEL